MKTLMFSLLIILSTNISISQTIDGIDITNLSDVNGWFEFEEDAYITGNLTHFDEAYLLPNEHMFFMKYEPTGKYFYDIFNYLVDILGEKITFDDNIPLNLKSSEYDYTALEECIQTGEASIKRIWRINEYGLNVYLSWDIENLYSNTIIIIVSKEAPYWRSQYQENLEY